ncbi:MAG: hypothetical protein WC683_06010 [bacterium]
MRRRTCERCVRQYECPCVAGFTALIEGFRTYWRDCEGGNIWAACARTDSELSRIIARECKRYEKE